MGANEQGRSQTPDAPNRPLEWPEVRAFLTSDPALIREDAALLEELGLRIHAANVLDFIPPALARRALANVHETAARKELEAIARANFAAQAQTHASVVDLLEARNHADLARRLHDTARLRFGLVAGVIALEEPGRTPAGWRTLEAGMCDELMGPQGLARMGLPLHAEALFGEEAPRVASVAMVRLAIWEPARQGVLAFGSIDPEGFTGDMGVELVAFIARVVERTAERWPVL
jgi:uncharacterized protein YigA (DUF484 family)